MLLHTTIIFAQSVYKEVKPLPNDCFYKSGDDEGDFLINTLPSCMAMADIDAKRKMKNNSQLYAALGASGCIKQTTYGAQIGCLQIYAKYMSTYTSLQLLNKPIK